MLIDSSGNVGIGTSSPGYKLEVQGSQNGFFGQRIYNTNSGSGAYSYLQLGNNTDQYAAFIALNSSANTSYGGANSLNIWQGLSAPITFGTNNTERARIDSSGNLLVARTDVVNQGRISVNMLGGTNVGLSVVNTNGGNTGNFCNFARSDTTVIGSISQASSTTVAYNTSSDYRLKEDVAPMTGALAKIADLKPCTYTWKYDGSAGQGFIAHELAEVVPECVTGEKDAVDAEGNPVYQGIDTSFLVATLTAAIQEQQTMIDTMKQEIAELKGLA
jgi:hypothetical protein